MSYASPRTHGDSLGLSLVDPPLQANTCEAQAPTVMPSLFTLCSPQSLHAMESHVMVKFLPTTLNQLFRVLTCAMHEEVAVNVARHVGGVSLHRI